MVPTRSMTWVSSPTVRGARPRSEPIVALDESAAEDEPRDPQEERSRAYRARRPEKVLVRSRGRKRQRRPPGGGSPRNIKVSGKRVTPPHGAITPIHSTGFRGWMGNQSPAIVMLPTHAYALTYGIRSYTIKIYLDIREESLWE